MSLVSHAQARRAARCEESAIDPLGDRGERPDVIEAIGGQTRKGVSAVHYNHSLMLPLVADALQRWADHLDTLSGTE